MAFSAMLPSPLFFPPVRWMRNLPQSSEESLTLAQWCERAGVPCRASGEWINRRVSWWRSAEMEIEAEPGYMSPVRIGVPSGVARHGGVEIARHILQVLAYSTLFDSVARESVRGIPWARNHVQRGRPKSSNPMSNAQRQRNYREGKRQSAAMNASVPE